MKNLTVYKMLIDEYNDRSFTHQYIWGFKSNGTVWASFTDASVIEAVCMLDLASRSAGCALRFKPTKAQKELLKQFKTLPLCSVEYFEHEVASCKYNAGEVFERMMTEYFGQVWVKDNVPFTQDGDLTVDGIAYQIKFEKATFINEKTLARLRAE